MRTEMLNSVKVDKHFLLQALQANHSVEDIANILNVTTEALNEVIQGYGLKKLAEKTNQIQSIDAKYNNLEEKVLDKLEKSLNNSFQPLTPLEYTRILQTLNGARRKTEIGRDNLLGGNEIGGSQRLVQINLPKSMEVEIKINSLNQVSEVDGRVVETQASSDLVKLLEEKENEKQRRLESEVEKPIAQQSPADLL